jgi:DNA-binding transcriptional regulator PaaX
MITYLKNNGLLQRKTMGDKTKLYITAAGRKKLAMLRRERRFDEGGRGYESTLGNKLIIVTYDIPEKSRRDRDWLRAFLKRLGLKLIQRSVWLGKVVIPQRFIEDLALRRITEFVEIVEVGSSGTIEHLM